MSLIEHAKREMELAWGNDPSEPQSWIVESVLELMEVLSKQGHSGTSAPYALGVFSRLAKYQILSPLTGDDSEWMEVAEGVYQNRRLSTVFKDRDRLDGKPYDINNPEEEVEFPYYPEYLRHK